MKKIVGIFTVFLIFFYAEISMGDIISLCGEEYKLKVPIFANKTVSFTDKYDNEIQIYELTKEAVSMLDNRTINQFYGAYPYYVYIKDNKAVGLSYKSDFYFLDHNNDECIVYFELRNYNKILPLSSKYNFDYSRLYGSNLKEIGYLGDNESIGNEVLADYDEYVNSKNSALTEELRTLLYNSRDLSKGFTVPRDTEKINKKYPMLYDNESFNTYMEETLIATLEQGINHVYVINFKGYTEEEIDEYIRENDGDISASDYMVFGIFLDELFVAFNYATPLMMAVYAGYNDVATYLLEHGANPAYSNGDADALLYAVVTNNKEMIYKLVEAGAPVILSRVYRNGVISYARTGTKEETEGTLEELMNEFLDKKTIKYLKQNAYKE